MMRGLSVCVLVATWVPFSVAGGGEWRNFTSMKDVRAVARTGSTSWAATGGGLFGWEEHANAFVQLTSAEGLQSVDLTAVAVDSLGNVWSGSSNGYLHSYSPVTRIVRVVPNIANTTESNKQINSIAIYGDTALVSTDFGLSTFRLSRFEFGDTYQKFAAIPPNNRVTVYAAAIYDGRLWAAVTDGLTNNGVAVADLSNPNILPPQAWTLQNVGSLTNVTTCFGTFRGNLYAGTRSGLYVLAGASWNAVSGLSGVQIQGIATSPSVLLVCTGSLQVFALDTLGVVSQIGPQLPFAASGIAARPNGDPIVACVNGGLVTGPPSWSSSYPNGPNGSQFINVAVDGNGVLWGASGSANGLGFYRFDGSRWASYTAQNNHLPMNEYYKVSVACNNSVWASSWGRGVVEMPDGTDLLDTARIYNTNIGMVGLSNDLSYVVVSNVVCDSRGTTWMTIAAAADRNILVARTSDGTWKRMPVHIGTPSGPTLATIIGESIDRSLAVDAYDNLWALVRDPARLGVISMANGGAIDSVARVYLSSADGLPSNDIRTIVVDHDNTIWVGTDKGIGIILDPANPTRNGAIAAYRPLDGLVINTIAVDPLNQKWVGTSEGAVLLSPDGTQELASYTVDGTGGKLIDNDVKSIAVDPKTGTVYFGTVSGLASLTTPAAAPKTAFEGLTVYPNPFKIPGQKQLTIDGLVENSSLKILTIDGRLIRDLTTPGGRVGYWDGKDANGNDVASGIYIIVAYSEDGSQVANGKVAVLKQH